MPNFTPEELVQYLYQESSSAMVLAIETALQTDWTLKEKLDVLKASQTELATIKLRSPRPQSVQAILNYAKLTTEVEQH
jgi:hypothetical protein